MWSRLRRRRNKTKAEGSATSGEGMEEKTTAGNNECECNDAYDAKATGGKVEEIVCGPLRPIWQS